MEAMARVSGRIQMPPPRCAVRRPVRRSLQAQAAVPQQAAAEMASLVTPLHLGRLINRLLATVYMARKCAAPMGRPPHRSCCSAVAAWRQGSPERAVMVLLSALAPGPTVMVVHARQDDSALPSISSKRRRPRQARASPRTPCQRWQAGRRLAVASDCKLYYFMLISNQEPPR